MFFSWCYNDCYENSERCNNMESYTSLAMLGCKHFVERSFEYGCDIEVALFIMHLNVTLPNHMYVMDLASPSLSVEEFSATCHAGGHVWHVNACRPLLDLMLETLEASWGLIGFLGKSPKTSAWLLHAGGACGRGRGLVVVVAALPFVNLFLTSSVSSSATLAICYLVLLLLLLPCVFAFCCCFWILVPCRSHCCCFLCFWWHACASLILFF